MPPSRMFITVLATLAGSGAVSAIASPLLAAPVRKPSVTSGDVTRAQMQAEINRIFDRADTNKDGFMSRAEFAVRMGAVLNQAPPGTPGAPTPQQAQDMLDAANAAFRAVDTNGDGKISRAEANKRPLAAFDMMDTNHDGILTVAEKRAAHQREAPSPVAGPSQSGPGR